MTKRIFLVYDEKAILDLISATLGHDDGYQFVTARDGKEALATALRHKPDLVLLDVLMPKRDGYYLCRALKQNSETAHITVFMLTALAQDRDSQRTLASGADGYLIKPFSPMALLKKLEDSLAVSQRASVENQ